MNRSTVLVVALVGALTSCSSDGDRATEPVAAGSSSTPANPIVGRWEQEHTCQQLVANLVDAGLGATAPAVAADYFPDQPARVLARKHDTCSGARPVEHAHFFTDTGSFGSLDPDGQQVDDGPYSVDGDVLTIGEPPDAGRFRFEVEGDTLRLHPLIRPADRKAATARPLEFSLAGWQVAVAYEGVDFHRVPCGSWC